MSAKVTLMVATLKIIRVLKIKAYLPLLKEPVFHVSLVKNVGFGVLNNNKNFGPKRFTLLVTRR